mgnify:CR=1 FL=1|jgi:hypothetical protein
MPWWRTRNDRGALKSNISYQELKSRFGKAVAQGGSGLD